MAIANAALMTGNWHKMLAIIERALRKNGDGYEADPQRVIRAVQNEELMAWLAAEVAAVENRHAAGIEAAENALREKREKAIADLTKVAGAFKSRADAAAAALYET